MDRAKENKQQVVLFVLRLKTYDFVSYEILANLKDHEYAAS